MPVSQVEYRLLSQLLRVVGSGSALQDDRVVGTDNVEITDPAAGATLDVTLDALGKILL
jgi:hypothetical protein